MLNTFYNNIPVNVTFDLLNCDEAAEYYSLYTFQLSLSNKHFQSDVILEDKIKEIVYKCREYGYYARCYEDIVEGIVITFEEPCGACSFSCLENFEKALKATAIEKIEDFNNIIDIPYELTLIITGVY